MHKLLKSTLLLVILSYSVGHLFASENHSDSIRQEVIQILSDKSQTEEQRFYKASDIIERSFSMQGRIDLLQTVMSDFCNNTIQDKEIRNRLLARLQLYLKNYYYSDFHDDNLSQKHLDSAMMYISNTLFDSYEKAFAYQNFADQQIQNGSVEIGHKYYWDAIKLYESLGKYEKNQSYCYYQLGTGYYQMHDTKGMKMIFEKMKQLLEKTDDKMIAFDTYSIGNVYYSILSEDEPQQKQWMDTIAQCALKTIEILETLSLEEMQKALINPVWNYYNYAIFYNFSDRPPMIDSIEKYLDKAEEAVIYMGYQGWEKDECNISIRDLRAWIYYYKKQYQKAEHEMLGVIRLIDSVDIYSPNTVIIEREQAYIFLVNLYEETGKLDKALQYQKLLNELTKKRFDIEKNAALHELTAQYEVEKQDCEISRLTMENEATQKMLWMTIGLCTLFLLLIIFILIAFRLRRKTLNQIIYEKALETENSQQDLRYRMEEMKLLQQEFEHLQELSDKNQEYSEKYKSDLDNIRKQLNEAPTKTLILNTAELIRQSNLSREAKRTYSEHLEQLEVETLDKIFASADQKLSTLDMKYIICFVINMETNHIADLFLISIDSVYSVRHRIRKKFGKNTKVAF